MDNASEASLWKEAITYAEKTVKQRVRLNSRYTGDVAQVKEDMVQDCLVAIAEAIKAHGGEDLDSIQMRSLLRGVVHSAIQRHLYIVNRQARREYSASEWLENMGMGESDDDDAATKNEQEPEETQEQQDALAEIIENNENDTLKASIICLDREMQAVVLLHNDGFSFTQIAKRMNRSRERPRQLYHKAMSELKMRATQQNKAEAGLLTLDWEQRDQDLLYSTQEEKLRELRYRPRSTQGNISSATRAMRAMQQTGKNAGQLSLF